LSAAASRSFSGGRQDREGGVEIGPVGIELPKPVLLLEATQVRGRSFREREEPAGVGEPCYSLVAAFFEAGGGPLPDRFQASIARRRVRLHLRLDQRFLDQRGKIG
jgi:hypothetical protein